MRYFDFIGARSQQYYHQELKRYADSVRDHRCFKLTLYRLHLAKFKLVGRCTAWPPEYHREQDILSQESLIRVV